MTETDDPPGVDSPFFEGMRIPFLAVVLVTGCAAWAHVLATLFGAGL